MERLVVNDSNVQLTTEHLESFAKDGLRTLCLAYRILTLEEYNVKSMSTKSLKIYSFCIRNGRFIIVKLQQRLTIVMN